MIRPAIAKRELQAALLAQGDLSWFAGVFPERALLGSHSRDLRFTLVGHLHFLSSYRQGCGSVVHELNG